MVTIFFIKVKRGLNINFRDKARVYFSNKKAADTGRTLEIQDQN